MSAHVPAIDHAGGVNEFDEPLLDDAAVWRTSNPPFGVVRVVVTDGEYSIVLDDQNSDYREVELQAYSREGRGWREIFSKRRRVPGHRRQPRRWLVRQ